MKKRMFLTTILMTLVLLVAVTTATFAWYSAAQGDANLSATDNATVAAKTDTITLGDLTFDVEFVGVDASFGGVDLTNDQGKSYYWTGSEAVEYTAQKSYGTAQVKVTANVADDADLAAALQNLYGSGTTVTLVVTAAGQVIVAKDASAVFSSEKGNAIEFSITLSEDGSVHEWTKDFVYSVRAANLAGDEPEGAHANDAITASLR